MFCLKPGVGMPGVLTVATKRTMCVPRCAVVSPVCHVALRDMSRAQLVYASRSIAVRRVTLKPPSYTVQPTKRSGDARKYHAQAR